MSIIHTWDYFFVKRFKKKKKKKCYNWNHTNMKYPSIHTPIKLAREMTHVNIPDNIKYNDNNDDVGVLVYQVESKTGYYLRERRFVIGSDKLSIHILNCNDVNACNKEDNSHRRHYHRSASSSCIRDQQQQQTTIPVYPGKKLKRRSLLLSHRDNKPSRIISVPSKRSESKKDVIMIDVSFIDRVQLGPWSYGFDLVQQKRCIEFIEDAAMSIFYDSNKCLDLVFPDIDDNRSAYHAVVAMLETYRSVIHDIDKDTLFMRFLWLRGLADDMINLIPCQKSNNYKICIDGFNTILKMMGAPAKMKMNKRKWRETTRAFANSLRHKIGPNRFSDKITFRQCLWLIEDLKREEVQPSDKIWNCVFGVNVSKVSFVGPLCALFK